MSSVISLSKLTGLHVLGTRHSAKEMRRLIDEVVSREGRAELDFSAVTLTQSFADELLGPLILEKGPAALASLTFKSCSEDVRAVIEFVVSGRLHDFRVLTAKAHSEPVEA